MGLALQAIQHRCGQHACSHLVRPHDASHICIPYGRGAAGRFDRAAGGAPRAVGAIAAASGEPAAQASAAAVLRAAACPDGCKPDAGQRRHERRRRDGGAGGERSGYERRAVLHTQSGEYESHKRPRRAPGRLLLATSSLSGDPKSLAAEHPSPTSIRSSSASARHPGSRSEARRPRPARRRPSRAASIAAGRRGPSRCRLRGAQEVGAAIRRGAHCKLSCRCPPRHAARRELRADEPSRLEESWVTCQPA